MCFERIDRLVSIEKFCFQAWDDRYSKGIWAALGLWEDQIDTVRDLSSAGDSDMIPAMDYLGSANWLPYVTGRTLGEAMQKLEALLAALPQDQLNRKSQWANLVSKAVKALTNATSGRAGHGDKRSDLLDDLPATFELAVEKAALAESWPTGSPNITEHYYGKFSPNPSGSIEEYRDFILTPEEIAKFREIKFQVNEEKRGDMKKQINTDDMNEVANHAALIINEHFPECDAKKNIIQHLRILNGFEMNMYAVSMAMMKIREEAKIADPDKCNAVNLLNSLKKIEIIADNMHNVGSFLARGAVCDAMSMLYEGFNEKLSQVKVIKNE